MASDLAFHLASRGYEVGAITSRQRYDDPRARLESGTAHGVGIERVWSTRFGRGGLIGRAVDYLTFYLSAFLAMRRERDSVLIAMTDPPLCSILGMRAARKKGARLVNWLTCRTRRAWVTTSRARMQATMAYSSVATASSR